MAENISIIKNALKSFSPAGEYDRSTFLLAAGKLSSTNPAESNLLKKIAEGDNFTAFDKDGNGKITDREIEEAAKFTSPNDILNEADLSEALSRFLRAVRRRPSTYTPPASSATPATSTSPSSPTPPPSSTSPPVQVPQINTYATDGYKKSSPSNKTTYGTQKTTILDAIKLDENRDVKVFIGEDQLAHFLIYSGNGYDTDHSLIKEYTIPLETLQQISLGSDKQTYLTFATKNYDFEKSVAKAAGAKVHLDISNPANKGKVTNLIKDLFLNDSSLSTLKNAEGVQFRQARGVEDLTHAKYGNPAGEIPPPEEYTNPIPDLVNLYSTLKCSTISWTGQRKGIAKLIEYKYTAGSNAGKTFYTLAYVPADSTGNPTNQILEYEFEESALKKIAQIDAQNIDFSDVNKVRDWLMTHFRFDSDSLTAYIHRKNGSAQFGEIEGLTVRNSELCPSLANAIQKLQSKKREKVVDLEKSFKTGKLNIPEPYKHGVPANVTKFLDLITKYNKLKGYEAPLKLPPIQTGSTTYKQIIINAEDITVINWGRINGAFQDVKRFLVKREPLMGTDFDMFTELTPNRLRNNSQERDYLEGEAQRYFGYATRYPSGSRSANESLDEISNKLEAGIKDLEESKRR